MAFFDLNLPFLPPGATQKTPASDPQKNTRLKLAVKAMELGYSGVAYDRSIKGVMSDSDVCSLHLFPLSSLLKVAPTLSSAVAFHRRLLGVPPNAPFRQYTRLTVSVDSALQSATLNSGNPVLKTYDLVAVRPLNQTTFEQACKASEVDLISIDFSQKLPFRLKLPMVQTAIERGIYFEITYSHLISDVQARRQMLAGAKLLVDWTRGKNLIISSAAPTVNELRGPNDVANLLSLLGLSMERSEAAISKNCRSLISNALRRKQFYKEAIKVERISDGELLTSYSWDPLSSGEGDLCLDDMAKSFSDASKVAKSVNWSHSSVQSPVTFLQFSAKELWSTSSTNKSPKVPTEVDGAVIVDEKRSAPTDLISEAKEPWPTCDNERRNNLNGVDVVLVAEEKSLSCTQVKDQMSEANEPEPKSLYEEARITAEYNVASVVSSTQSVDTQIEANFMDTDGGHASLDYNVTFNKSVEVVGQSVTCDEHLRRSHEHEIAGGSCDVDLVVSDMPSLEDFTEVDKQEEIGDVVISTDNLLAQETSVTLEEQTQENGRVGDRTPEEVFVKLQELTRDNGGVADTTPDKVFVKMEQKLKDVAINDIINLKYKPEKGKLKRKSSHPIFPMPFKGLLKVFGKKVRR